MKRWPLVATFVLFIAVCISAAYWAMQLFKPPQRPVAAPPQMVQPAPRLDAAALLFGGRTTSAVAINFQLKGVVVADKASESVAILVVGGKPAQAVRANAEVAPGIKVQEVQPRYVLLSEGGVVRRIELPEVAKGQAGVNRQAGVETQTGADRQAGVATQTGTGVPAGVGGRARASRRARAPSVEE